MARRFRRRKRYTWFPTAGTEVTRTGQTTFVANPLAFNFTFGAGVDVAHVQKPLVTADFPIEDDFTTETLNDIVGNEYVVERIVGNLFGTAYLEGTVSGEYPGAALLGFGICVARADGNSPIYAVGSADAMADTQAGSRNYNPLELQTIREPWMFRRLWVLSTRSQDLVNADPVNLNEQFGAQSQRDAHGQAWPRSTQGYWGRDSGPFIDVKSVRRIRQDERLWAVLAAMPYPIGYGGSAPTGSWAVRVDAMFDYRILGALRRSKNRSNF